MSKSTRIHALAVQAYDGVFDKRNPMSAFVALDAYIATYAKALEEDEGESVKPRELQG